MPPFYCLALSILLALTSLADAQPPEAAPTRQPAQTLQASLNEWVTELREEKELVGLAAAVMVKGRIDATSAVGVRKKGADTQLTADDRFHLGSITKSFTATAAARLIERNEIRWETTVTECFGDKLQIHADWKDATLEHFLTHTAGAQPNFGINVMVKKPPAGRARMEARREAVQGVLRNPPKTKPGEKYKYSNVGFTIAGVMLEHITGKAWEDLIQEEIFKPLKLKDTGFGPPKDNGQALSQPQGHRKLALFKIPVGQDADNTPIIGPAGTIHMSLDDLCRYGDEHRIGDRGEGRLLTAKSYQRLHRARLSDYACGWVAPKTNRFTDGRLYWHNGSNTMWFAMLAVLPDLQTVVAVTANDGDIAAAQDAAFAIITRAGKKIAQTE